MRKTLAIIAAIAALAVLAAPAAQAEATQVSGTQSPLGPGVWSMDGSLVGTWYDTTSEEDFLAALRAHPSGTVQLLGTELFVGCLGNVCGSLEFEFHAELKLLTPDYVQLVRGRCQHVITAGHGGFAGATGVLTFRDDPVTGCSDYKGHIKLA